MQFLIISDNKRRQGWYNHSRQDLGPINESCRVIIQRVLRRSLQLNRETEVRGSCVFSMRSPGCFSVGPPVAKGLICIQSITNNSCILICMSYFWHTEVLAVNAAWRARNRAKRDQPSPDWLSCSHAHGIGRKNSLQETSLAIFPNPYEPLLLIHL